jgi:hypothetical protein
MRNFDALKGLYDDIDELSKAYNLLREIYLIYIQPHGLGLESVINGKTVDNGTMDRLLELFEEEEY